MPGKSAHPNSRGVDRSRHTDEAVFAVACRADSGDESRAYRLWNATGSRAPQTGRTAALSRSVLRTGCISTLHPSEGTAEELAFLAAILLDPWRIREIAFLMRNFRLRSEMGQKESEE